ncbi:MarR family transcriptional regulator [Ammonicoccus fulvus]|uniref:MarR family transcriptional regulator n=1 Tax=Ammonicoccus fulvus TaxID=3138240 RepID=A0ABZ3FN09_9ACTN
MRGNPASEREGLERELADLVRALSAASTRVAHDFAHLHELGENDMRALMLIYMADVEGTPMSTSQVAQALGLTPAGGSYLVDRLVHSGHIRREPHPNDRRKTLLRYSESGMEVARGFFGPLFRANHRALAGHDDAALAAAISVLRAVVGSMHGFSETLNGPLRH